MVNNFQLEVVNLRFFVHFMSVLYFVDFFPSSFANPRNLTVTEFIPKDIFGVVLHS